VNDVGGSIIVHAFGAYFGLACSRGFAKKSQRESDNEGSIYHTDLFAMIGAIFLWIFWPSFNAVVATPENARVRAMMNTYLSLAACTLTTFVVSQLVDHEKRFNMVHIANSTLAGGVAIGTTANVILSPFHALLIGTIAGIISVLGFAYITPFLSKKLSVHDTCGVNNLHGMPGVLAAIFSAIFVMIYDPKIYGDSLTLIYPAWKSESNKEGREASSQALFQLAGIATVLVASILSGMATGFLLRLKIWNQVRVQELYSDGDYFETPNDYDFITKATAKIERIELASYEEKLPLKPDP